MTNTQKTLFTLIKRAGHDGLSPCQIESVTGIPEYSVRPRLNELEYMGAVKQATYKRMNRRGNPEKVVYAI